MSKDAMGWMGTKDHQVTVAHKDLRVFLEKKE